MKHIHKSTIFCYTILVLDIKALTIKEAGEMMRKGETTAVALVSACLENIKAKNSELNIFLEVFDDALEQAKRADEMLKKGNTSPLCGIPIAIKDNILMTGKKVSAGSKMLAEYRAGYDATVTRKLREAGAVFRRYHYAFRSDGNVNRRMDALGQRALRPFDGQHAALHGDRGFSCCYRFFCEAAHM